MVKIVLFVEVDCEYVFVLFVFGIFGVGLLLVFVFCICCIVGLVYGKK